MARGRPQMHTIFHVMEARGAFAGNPANPESYDENEGTSLYKGPVEYPKMFYHPEGETHVLVEAQPVVNPVTGEPLLDRRGEQIMRGEQREVIWQLAQTPEDEEALRDEGWHDHPALAIAAGGGKAPEMSSEQRIKDLQAQLARTQADLSKAQGTKPGAKTPNATAAQSPAISSVS